MSIDDIIDILKKQGFQPEVNLAEDGTEQWRTTVDRELFRVSFSDLMWVLYRDYERLDYGFELSQLAAKLHDEGLRKYTETAKAQ